MLKNKRMMLLAGVAAVVMGGAFAFSDIPLTGGPVAFAEKGDTGHSGQGGQGAGGQGHYGGKGGQGSGMSGQQGGHSAEDVMRGGHDSSDEADEGEDSDRPEWAGTSGKEGKPGRPNPNPGVSKGGIYGDMYVLLRDENGVPILNENGFVQPVDSEGNPIALDEEGHPLDETATVEVELERLNVGRSPSGVLSSRLKEAVGILDSATALSLDASGRIVATVDGEQKTIDSPLENLALYVKLVNDGTLGLTLDNSVLGDLAYLNDGAKTAEDMTAAASFLAAASGKYTPITTDSVVYMNTILGVDGTIDQNGTEYVDYSNFSYDRSDAYDGVMVDILEQTGSGVYETKSVNLYDAVFGGQDYSSTSGVEGFTQAADDARAVIAYVHDHSAPEDGSE